MSELTRYARDFAEIECRVFFPAAVARIRFLPVAG